jgi:pyrroloquinoline quinone biosynthesis protein E
VKTPRLYNLVAELTYRCPLRCVYCSNPIDFASRRETLDGAAWGRVLREAAQLGALHVGLTGGEPALHPDLAEIVDAAHGADLYTHLITAGTTLDAVGLAALRDAGLRSIQLSFQDVDTSAALEIAGVDVLERKFAFARQVRELELPLCVNVVLHRRNLERVPQFIELAVELGAHRLELANTQYYGWALSNRDALLPSAEQIARAAAAVERARARAEALEIVHVIPDYHAGRPKPCMGGWGQKICVVAPDGRVLPCHAAAELPGLKFWSVPARSLAQCWGESPGMNAFRGTDWLREPCRSCPDRERDFGGCRCQAFALTGDLTSTDPACQLAPDHGIVRSAVENAETSEPPLRLRG